MATSSELEKQLNQDNNIDLISAFKRILESFRKDKKFEVPLIEELLLEFNILKKDFDKTISKSFTEEEHKYYDLYKQALKVSLAKDNKVIKEKMIEQNNLLLDKKDLPNINFTIGIQDNKKIQDIISGIIADTKLHKELLEKQKENFGGGKKEEEDEVELDEENYEI